MPSLHMSNGDTMSERFVRFVSVFSVVFLMFSIGLRYIQVEADRIFYTKQVVVEEFLPTTYDAFIRKHSKEIDLLAFLIGEYTKNEKTAERIAEILFVEAYRHNIPPLLAYSLIAKESSFRQHVVSSVGAVGLCQVMPFWKRIIGSENDDLFDIRTNIWYGMEILSRYMKRYDDVDRALAAYNGSKYSKKYPKQVKSIMNRAQTITS